MREYLETLCDGEHLTREQTSQLFGTLVEGSLEPEQIAALLVALRAKGEQPDEIAGAAGALRSSALYFPRPSYAFADSCGTGGDGARTINVSTAVAVVAAELSIPVAKHGNRSVSSQCGSADVLERFGVKLDPAPQVARRCLDEAGLCFLFAPQYHPGLRHAMPVRRALGIRTMMNLLGPLVNPAAPTVQIVGVYDPALCAPVAETLALLGCKSALVVHGSGLDEIAVHGPTRAARLEEGDVTLAELTPEQAGLEAHPLEALRGGDAAENLAHLERLLGGEGAEAHEAAVALNAGALAWVFGAAGDLADGTAQAREALRSGRCLDRLRRLAELSHGA